ncbi:universal stress protein [Pontibacter toksunensis]|uniref:Universal stress protein n=1 Tax=Pontibacter toksunensis TaxID=1332631 RepID=A0ABW6BRE7_9BACT
MSSTLKKILIPVDVEKSAESLLLLCYAGQFAAAFGAELLLLHPTYTPELTFTEQSRKIQVLRALGERVLGRLPKLNTHVPFECLVRPGSLHDCIKDVVQSAAVDLVLMQADKLPESEKELYADHAAHVMEIISCPLVVVPSALAYKKLRHLVFATDFTDRDPKVLAQISDFAGRAGARLTLVQVYSKAERTQLCNIKAAMHQVEEQLSGKNVRLKLLEEEDVLEGISDFAEDVQADMLVLATRDNYLMQRLFSKAYVKTMAYHTQIPLLTFRQLKKKPCSGCCTNCMKSKAQYPEIKFEEAGIHI